MPQPTEYTLSVVDFLRISIMARSDSRATAGNWKETFEVFNDIAGALNDGDTIRIVANS